MIDGFLVIDKPAGCTSHDVVGMVRKAVGQKKVGHTGTLDPFATGVLPIALGEGTKAIPYLDEAVKEYQAVMKLGVATDTQDCVGAVIRTGDWSSLNEQALVELAQAFVGPQLQMPPMFSALKKNGVPLYKLARQGTEVERAARQIEVFSLTVDRVELPEVSFTVRCSRGTYVRTLAHDMGDKLGCGAHLVQLRRTTSGIFSIKDAISPEVLKEPMQQGLALARLLTPYDALGHLKDLVLTENGAEKVYRGIAPRQDDISVVDQQDAPAPGELVRLSHNGKLLAVAESAVAAAGAHYPVLRLSRVFNP